MNFLFRVDAGGEIGLGHFYRSVNLAKHLTKNGHNIIFIHLPSDFWNKLNKKEFKFAHYQLESDIDQLDLVKEFLIEVFYVDGIIEFDKELLDDLREYSKVVFYQNTSKSRHLCDLFILPSIHQREDFFKNFPDETAVYQGLEYFTFSETIEKFEKKPKPDIVSCISIMAGGSDPNDTLRVVYDLINFDAFDTIRFNFHYGKEYLFLDQVPKETPKRVTWLPFNLEEIYHSDMIISAFGVSTYEFLALSMPIISYGHQESNAKASNYLAKNTGALSSIGLFNEIDYNLINFRLEMLIKNKAEREKMIENAAKIIDLHGIERVMYLLENIEE